MFFWALESLSSYYRKSDAIGYGIAGLLFVAAWIYFCCYYGKASTTEIASRTKLGSITGMYAMPHWISYPELRNLLGNYQ